MDLGLTIALTSTITLSNALTWEHRAREAREAYRTARDRANRCEETLREAEAVPVVPDRVEGPIRDILLIGGGLLAGGAAVYVWRR